MKLYVSLGSEELNQCYFKRTEAFHLTEAATNKKDAFYILKQYLETLACWLCGLPIVAVINFDVQKSADLLNTAVIQNRSYKRSLLCSKSLCALINLEAEFGAGA